jgi:hypothetical protein
MTVRDAFLVLLDGWEAGTIDDYEAMARADGLEMEVDAQWGHGDARADSSRALEVLSEALNKVSLLYATGAQPEDAPAIRRFVLAAERDPEGAWREWHAYWEGIDVEARTSGIVPRLSADPEQFAIGYGSPPAVGFAGRLGDAGRRAVLRVRRLAVLVPHQTETRGDERRDPSGDDSGTGL